MGLLPCYMQRVHPGSWNSDISWQAFHPLLSQELLLALNSIEPLIAATEVQAEILQPSCCWKLQNLAFGCARCFTRGEHIARLLAVLNFKHLIYLSPRLLLLPTERIRLYAMQNC